LRGSVELLARDEIAAPLAPTDGRLPPAAPPRRATVAAMADPGALSLAALNGDLEAVRALLAAGASPEGVDGLGRTALENACLRGEHAIAQVLVAAGAALDRGEEVPLLLALRWNRAELVAFLRRHGARLDARDRFGRTPLHAAVSSTLGVIEDLVAAGAALEARDNAGYTPLMLAAGSGRAAAVAELLRLGASARAADRFHREPVHDAAVKGDVDVLAALRPVADLTARIRGNGWSPMHLAALNARTNVIEALLGWGVPPEEAGDALSPAFLARSRGHHDAVAPLVAAGARTDGFPDADLIRATDPEVGDLELARAALAAGASPSVVDPLSHTPALHGAVSSGVVELVRILVAAGADPNVTLADGETCIEALEVAGHPPEAEAAMRALLARASAGGT
jgi:ankyrin repeat protein